MKQHMRFCVGLLMVLMLLAPRVWAQTPGGSNSDAEIAQLKRRLAELEAAKAPAGAPAVAVAQAPDNTPLRPLEQSELVIKGADGAPIVANKDGSGLDGIKLSQHDMLIG